jgi:hypothetical protein
MPGFPPGIGEIDVHGVQPILWHIAAHNLYGIGGKTTSVTDCSRFQTLLREPRVLVSQFNPNEKHPRLPRCGLDQEQSLAGTNLKLDPPGKLEER